MSVNTSLADETEFFSKTFEPITLGDGTWYASCTGAKILAYTNPDPGPAPFQTKADATRELNNFLINQWPNARVRSALYQIKQVIDTPDWGPDTMVKMLPDLDVAFFDGRLRSRVHASWQDWHSIQSLNPPVPDFANLLGITWFRCQTNTCSICLNRQKICLDPGGPRLLMLQTLVHEMVHAWDFLNCPLQPQDNIDSDEDFASSHGWQFRWVINLLDERTRRYLGFGVIADWEDYRIANVATARRDLPF